ncbi:MAG: InlB B-repeat-containing protein [Bacilli bacterium]|nr:InlB B-repeat-containing protein [Bacilli bacterium]
MNKKLFVLASVSLLLGLTGCSNQGTSTGSKESGGETSQASTPVTVTYRVTFDSDGGSEVAPQTVEEGKKVTKPTDPTRPGRVFEGWFNGENEWNFDIDVVTADITLKAKWKLNVSPVLEDALTPIAINEDSEMTVWTRGNFEVTSDSGHWFINGSIKADWKTMMVFDGDGKICWGVWCPANGFGGPASYAYVHNFDYSISKAGCQGNPAFEFGEHFGTDSKDFKIVVPEGGFALTSIGEGGINSGRMVGLISGGEHTEIGEQFGYGPEFNTPNCQWSNRTMKYDAEENRVNVYCLATSMTFTGSKSGVAVGNADTGEYAVTVGLAKGNNVTFKYDNGIRASVLKGDKFTLTGAPEATIDSEDNSIIRVSKTGNYTFTYNVNTKTMDVVLVEGGGDKGILLEAPVSDVNADGNLAIWTEQGTKLHEPSGWTIGNGWRTYMVIDKDGRLMYYCYNPPNGYGGPTAASRNYHSMYADGTTNPAVELLPGFGPWEPGGTAHNQWNLVIPEGGFAITAMGENASAITGVLTGGAVDELSDATIAAANKHYEAADKVRFVYDASARKLTLKEEGSTPTAKAQAKIGAATIDMPAIYDESHGNITKSDYTIGVDENGTIIFASYTADGYGGPADGFYHDGNYVCVPGQQCGVFFVHEDFAPWAPGIEGAPWNNYDIKAAAGMRIITGNAMQMAGIIEALFEQDVYSMETNTYFERELEDGELNEKKVSFTPTAEDATIVDITVTK